MIQDNSNDFKNIKNEIYSETIQTFYKRLFLWNGTFYEQSSSSVMGSQISKILQLITLDLRVSLDLFRRYFCDLETQ